MQSDKTDDHTQDIYAVADIQMAFDNSKMMKFLE